MKTRASFAGVPLASQLPALWIAALGLCLAGCIGKPSDFNLRVANDSEEVLENCSIQFEQTVRPVGTLDAHSDRIFHDIHVPFPDRFNIRWGDNKGARQSQSIDMPAYPSHPGKIVTIDLTYNSSNTFNARWSLTL